MPKYEIILYWSEEDQSLIAEVPELPGFAAEGEASYEALQNLEIVVQEWIETAKELGWEIPKSKAVFCLTENGLNLPLCSCSHIKVKPVVGIGENFCKGLFTHQYSQKKAQRGF